jgi:hypothetical protein
MCNPDRRGQAYGFAAARFVASFSQTILVYAAVGIAF